MEHDDQGLEGLIAINHGSIAWYRLFLKDFKAAEQSARTAIAMSEEAEWVNNNLALALLYQGKYTEAKDIYLAFKDKTRNNGRLYKDIMLETLDDLENEGITHKDVKKIRKLLNKQ